MGEPLLTRRKALDDTETGRIACPRTKERPCGRSLSQGAACMWPWRCPAYRWRELVAGASREQENLSSRYGRPVEMGDVSPWSSRGRTASGDHRERQSTDARHRDGTTRSSDEGLVMRLERRGRAGQVTQRSTLRGTSR
jgi:hypothetical protein